MLEYSLCYCFRWTLRQGCLLLALLMCVSFTFIISSLVWLRSPEEKSCSCKPAQVHRLRISRVSTSETPSLGLPTFFVDLPVGLRSLPPVGKKCKKGDFHNTRSCYCMFFWNNSQFRAVKSSSFLLAARSSKFFFFVHWWPWQAQVLRFFEQVLDVQQLLVFRCRKSPSKRWETTARPMAHPGTLRLSTSTFLC